MWESVDDMHVEAEQLRMQMEDMANMAEQRNAELNAEKATADMLALINRADYTVIEIRQAQAEVDRLTPLAAADSSK